MKSERMLPMNRLSRLISLLVMFLWFFVWTGLIHAQGNERMWRAAAFGDLEAVKSAVAQGANVNFKGPGGFTPMNAAARNGHLEVVKYLAEHGADIDKSDNNRDKTPLLAASFKGHFDIVKYLVEKGAKVNAQSINGFTPLHDAAYVGNLEIVKYLVEHGANVHIRNKHNQTPAETAVEGSRRAAANGRTNATPEDYEKVISYLKSQGGD
jgi:ankyrin repeat protein